MAKYTLIYSVLVEATIVVILSMPIISKKIRGATVKRVPLRLYILL